MRQSRARWGSDQVKAAMLVELQVRDQMWQLDERSYVMGILNVTPDSFSDGGRWYAPEDTLAQARALVAAGADILDIGGESTRPGFQPVPADEEIARVVPAIRAIRAEMNVPISLDTRKAAVARAAAAEGADLINDVTGLRGDPEMAGVAAETGLPLCIMHWADVETGPGLMAQIRIWLAESIDMAVAAGVPRERLILDPGVGFGKDLAGNLQIIRELGALRPLGLPILLGTSRKRVIGEVLDLPVGERLEGTAATVALGIANGAHIVRVHDVREIVRTCRMTDAILGRGPGAVGGR
jgi:dihydropteroate synthase